MVLRPRWIMLGLMLTVAVGCPQPTSVEEVADFGRFEGEVIAQWNSDGRMMTLREDFAYVDPTNRRWVAPAGSMVNGASIPAPFWSIIGGPFEGKYRNASVIHDVGCETMSAPWQDVHKVFYDACRCGGVDDVNAKMLYYAVYHFGPRWEIVTDTMVANARGSMVAPAAADVPAMSNAHSTASVPATHETAEAKTMQRMARFDPPPPTAEEVAQVAQMIIEENPSAEAIQKLDRKEMRRRGRAKAESGSSKVAPSIHDASPTGDAVGSGRFGGRETLASDSRWNDNDASPFNPLRREQPSTPGQGPNALRTTNAQPLMAASHLVASQPAQLATVTTSSMVTPAEQSRLVEIAKNYVDDQTGEERPALYTVDLAEGAYRVVVHYLHEDESGNPQRDGTCSTLFISQSGQMLEVFSGER